MTVNILHIETQKSTAMKTTTNEQLIDVGTVYNHVILCWEKNTYCDQLFLLYFVPQFVLFLQSIRIQELRFRSCLSSY